SPSVGTHPGKSRSASTALASSPAGTDANPHMNQLQAVALNEGVRRKKGLWGKEGRAQLESFLLLPWATRRRQDLLELLDRLKPIITDLNTAVQEEAERQPEARRLMTHPGVGPTTALAFVLILGTPATLPVRQTDRKLL